MAHKNKVVNITVFPGIPYLNAEEEKSYKESLTQRQKLRAKQNNSQTNDRSDMVINMTDNDKLQVDNIL